MLTTKSAIKWIILITATTLMQIEVIRVKGHWILGGNMAFPFLMAILLWWCPRVIKDFKGGFKNVDKN